jgi:hypothetical protein
VGISRKQEKGKGEMEKGKAGKPVSRVHAWIASLRSQ